VKPSVKRSAAQRERAEDDVDRARRLRGGRCRACRASRLDEDVVGAVEAVGPHRRGEGLKMRLTR
jgi:hypothetical protein